MTTLPPCCSVTAVPGSDPFLAQTICQTHAAQGWQKVHGRIDCVDSQPCGCTFAAIQGSHLNRCPTHAQLNQGRCCCDQATPRHCVCAFAFDCSTHGSTHVGTHD